MIVVICFLNIFLLVSTSNAEGHLCDLTIIGLGGQGSSILAVLLEESSLQYFNICLVEREETILSSSSTTLNAFDKVHTGSHYSGDISTASLLMSESTTLLRMISDSEKILSQNVEKYLHPKSLVGVDEMIFVLNQLDQQYSDYKNSVNKTLSEEYFPLCPEFYSKIDVPEHVIKKDGVSHAFEICEYTFNQSFYLEKRNYLLSALDNNENENFRLFLNETVQNISWSNEVSGYFTILTNDKKFYSRLVVNSAWENIHRIDHPLELPRDYEFLIRRKTTLHIETDLPTLIFTQGPFLSVKSNMDGTAFVSYEPISNELVDWETLEPMRRNKYRQSEEKRKKMILKGVSEELVGINESTKVLRVRDGFVRMYVPIGTNEEYRRKYLEEDEGGEDNILMEFLGSPTSCVHKRKENGVEIWMEGKYITAAGQKFTLVESNAKIVVERLKDEIDKIIDSKTCIDKD